MVISKITDAIKHTNFYGNVYLVGGAVRDIVMGKSNTVTDFDFVVVGHGIDGGIKLANFLKKEGVGRGLAVFRRFGTATLTVDGKEVDFVAPRKETYTPGSRNPEVVEGTLEDDVARRDFSINSIMINIANGQTIDKAGGSVDIKNKIIRTTSDPAVIFKEDPLRILRAIRFATRFDFEIETDTKEELIKNVDKLSFISNERIRDEFNKILMDKNFEKGLYLLMETGILAFMIPAFGKVNEIINPGKFHTKNLFGHLIDVVKKTEKTLDHRLAALLHDIGKVHTLTVDDEGVHFHGHSPVSAKIARGFLFNYKYPLATQKRVSRAIELHMDFWDNINLKRLRKLHAEMGMEDLLFVFDLLIADSKNYIRVKAIEKVIDTVKSDEFIVAPPVKPIVNGNEIMERYKLKPSKEVGLLLDIVKDMMYENPTVTKEEVFGNLDLKVGGIKNG